MGDSDSEQVEQNYLFSGKVDNVGAVATLLKTVAFCDKVNIHASEGGLKFTVEEGKYIQANILVPRELFLDFDVPEDGVCFKIPLKELLECLKIFTNDGKGASGDTTVDSLANTTLQFVYRQEGSPLEIRLEENGSLTEIELKTEEMDNLMEVIVEPADCKVVMSADALFELLSEIDNNSPDFIEISILNESMFISATGVSGRMQVILPSRARVVDVFECQSTQACKASYKLSILKYAFKALQIGQKVVLKMNTNGILSLAFLFPSKVDSFVEFICLPNITAEDPEEEPE